MRIRVIKTLVMGPTSKRERFLERVQQKGIVECIGPRSFEIPPDIQSYMDALHVLRTMTPVKVHHQAEMSSSKMVARYIVEHKEHLEHLEEKKRTLENEMSRIEAFGEFSLHTLREIEEESGRLFQFYFTKKSEGLEAVERPEVLFVAHHLGLDYYVAINEEKTTYPGLVEIQIEKSLDELQHELAETKREIDHLETELGMLSHQKKGLERGLVRALNKHHLEVARDQSEELVSGAMFAITTWVPKNKMKELRALADELDLYVEQIKIEKEEHVPTHLENKGWGRLGEDLVDIYDTPSTHDRDPSLWVFIAFGIFFAMIIADFGYGFLLFALSLFMKWKFKQVKGALKRFIKLVFWLSIGCMIWGVMLTSIFGIELKPDNPARKVSLINWMVERKADYVMKTKNQAYQELVRDHPELKSATNAQQFLMGVTKEQEGMSKYVIYQDFTDNVLIELSIFIGFVHIVLSFLRYIDRNWSGAGWVLFMVGAYLYFPVVIGATSLIYYIFGVPVKGGADVGMWILFVGLGLAWVLAIIQHKLAGAAEIMHVIQVFADVMSYLRIYALSLAGMIMATTFDQIGTSVPIYVGVFIILAGHAVNLTLALMGGVIHGLRLNFIEWYHYSFEGGGRKLRPLALLEIEE